MNKAVNDLVKCLIEQSRRTSECEKLLVTIYRNDCHPVARNLIEALAEKHQGDFKYELDIVKAERS
jgi:hypothetical protein